MSVLLSQDLVETLSAEQVVTADDLETCLSYPPQTVETSHGTIEYADRGQGPVVLIAHGGPGGYDQALMLGKLFRKNGFRIIAPSRPGYLGTTYSSGCTAAGQGDFMAALLDALQIPEAAVVGMSAGGPSAYQLAQRYPERTKALLVIDGISMNYTKVDDISRVEEWMYLSRPGLWLTGLLFKHFPATVVKSFLQTESSLKGHDLGERVEEILSDANKFAMMDGLFKTMTTRPDDRKVGTEYDISVGKGIDKLPLDRIVAPTLIVHGDADTDVPLRDAEYAHETIAGADLLVIQKASHIGFLLANDAYKVQKYALDWLEKTLAGETASA